MRVAAGGEGEKRARVYAGGGNPSATIRSAAPAGCWFRFSLVFLQIRSILSTALENLCRECAPSGWDSVRVASHQDAQLFCENGSSGWIRTSNPPVNRRKKRR
jgi:hypothetical protein